MACACPAFAAGQAAAGTYEFAILHPAIEGADTVASGVIVLMEEAVPTDNLAPELLETARRASRWLIRFGEVTPTACFGFRTSRARVGDREFLGGITEGGLTTWVQAAEGVEVRLYQSPDAWLVLRGVQADGHLAGGVEHRNHDGSRLDDSLQFVATRLGPPSSADCENAIQMGQGLVRGEAF